MPARPAAPSTRSSTGATRPTTSSTTTSAKSWKQRPIHMSDSAPSQRVTGLGTREAEIRRTSGSTNRTRSMAVPGRQSGTSQPISRSNG